jgi:hypothetical protein
MNKPRVYLKDYNGINQSLGKRTDELEFVDDPRDCQVIVTWQDVRGDMLELAKINKEFLHKPFITVQHGRGCTRDYEAPDNFPLMCDKFCCWGQNDYDRLVKLGYKDRAVITGSPLLNRIKPKEAHTDRNVIFAPVTTMHEEPDNLITFYELKKMEFDSTQEALRTKRSQLIEDWNPQIFNPELNQDIRIPYYEINKNFRVIAKLTPVHDRDLYLGAVTMTAPTQSNHIENSVKLLQQTDVVVCLEEGTFQVLVMAMDIPVIVVKGFKLTNYGGQNYTDREVVKTNGARWVELGDLREAIEEELSNPSGLRKERMEVVRREFGDINSNPDDNIIKVIKGELNG